MTTDNGFNVNQVYWHDIQLNILFGFTDFPHYSHTGQPRVYLQTLELQAFLAMQKDLS